MEYKIETFTSSKYNRITRIRQRICDKTYSQGEGTALCDILTIPHHQELIVPFLLLYIIGKIQQLSLEDTCVFPFKIILPVYLPFPSIFEYVHYDGIPLGHKIDVQEKKRMKRKVGGRYS